MHSIRFAILLPSFVVQAAMAAPSELSGEWRVEELNGAPLVDGSLATIRFSADGKVSGRGSCNRYGASFRVDQDRISFSPAMATRMACAPALMAQESLFFSIIEKAERWTNVHGLLTITAADGSAIRAARAK